MQEQLDFDPDHELDQLRTMMSPSEAEQKAIDDDDDEDDYDDYDDDSDDSDAKSYFSTEEDVRPFSNLHCVIS